MGLHMKQFKYKIVLHKRYFDIGMGITSYVKYLIAFFGLASRDLRTTLIIGFAYAFFCYFFGMFWVKSGFFKEEQEVSNNYNKFVLEMRKKIKG